MTQLLHVTAGSIRFSNNMVEKRVQPAFRVRDPNLDTFCAYAYNDLVDPIWRVTITSERGTRSD